MKYLFFLSLFMFSVTNSWADYCPFTKGSSWVYQGEIYNEKIEFKQLVTEEQSDNDQTSFVMTSVANDLVLLNTFFLRKENGKLILSKKITLKGEEISYSPARIEMLCNAQVGDSWTWQSDDGVNILEYEAISIEKVTVPAGEFKAIKIKFSGVLEGSQILDSYYWFSESIGSVKEAINTQNIRMIRELTTYEIK